MYKNGYKPVKCIEFQNWTGFFFKVLLKSFSNVKVQGNPIVIWCDMFDCVTRTNFDGTR